MTLEEYKQELKEEWEFQKRNPEIILLEIIVVLNFILAIRDP